MHTLPSSQAPSDRVKFTRTAITTACLNEQAEICPHPTHVNLQRTQGGPASPLTPTVEGIGSRDNMLGVLLSSPVILAMAIGRGSEAPI